MILQKIKKGASRRRNPAMLAEEVDDLRRHDWTDPLFDEWCASATQVLTFDAEAAREGAYCQLVFRICV